MDIFRLLGSYIFSLQAANAYHRLSIYCSLYTIFVYCWEKICTETMTQLLYTIQIIPEVPYLMPYFILWNEYITRTLRMENNLPPWSRHTLSISVGTVRGIDNAFPPDDPWFGSNANTNCAVIYNCRDGIRWPALSGHWLSSTECWHSLNKMEWLMYGYCFSIYTPH